MEEDWNDRQLEEECNIIVKWAQEDVETSYKLINNNMFRFYISYSNVNEITCFKDIANCISKAGLLSCSL